MSKADRLGAAVKKVAGAAMATADDRFAAVDTVIGNKYATPPAAPPTEPPTAEHVSAPIIEAPTVAPMEKEAQTPQPAAAHKLTETKRGARRAGQGGSKASEMPEPAPAEVIRKKLTVMLDEADWKNFRRSCIDEGVTGQDVLERLVKKYLIK